MGFPLPCDAAASTYRTSQPGVPVPPTSRTTRSKPSCRPTRMSLTVTDASEEACSVSGSASAGNAGAPVSPASAEPCAGAVVSARVGVPDDDDDCVPGWAQPARTAGVAARLSSRAVTVRGRFLTDRASQAGPPGMDTPRRHVLFLPPPANYEPPSSSGPGRRPFKAVARVRTPLGARTTQRSKAL